MFPYSKNRDLERVVRERRVGLDAVVSTEDLVLAHPDEADDVRVDRQRASPIGIQTHRVALTVAEGVRIVANVDGRRQIETGRCLTAGQQPEVALGVVAVELGAGEIGAKNKGPNEDSGGTDRSSFLHASSFDMPSTIVAACSSPLRSSAWFT